MLTSTLIRISSIPRHSSGSLHLFVGFHPFSAITVLARITGFLLS
jgi:hypothetical protein